MTFRVEEEEGEEEVQGDIVEEPTNPRIGEGVSLHMRKSIKTGMQPRQLDPAKKPRGLKKMSHGGIRTTVGKTKRSLRIETIVGKTRRSLRIETPLGTSLGTMKKEREQGALAQEERDTVGEAEARIGREVEENTMMTEESTEVITVPAEGSTAQIGRPEGSIAQIDRTEGTTAPDIGKERVDPETEGNIHQKKAEGTLAITDEVVAEGPLVMEGPLQASP